MTLDQTVRIRFPITLVLPAAAAAIYALETRRPLRRATQPKLSRNLRNLAVAGVAGAVVALLERPLIGRLARQVERRKIGFVQQLPVRPILRTAGAVALMDYTLFAWHVLMHKVPFLWRLHLPHHADLDLDASTALRFHFSELAASIPWRAAQVTLIGAGPRALRVWQAFTIACIVFHHSNLRLPVRTERMLGLVLATPRMHGIHHSAVREETEANWSSGLSIWDRLHGTLRVDVPQSQIEIGVPAWQDPGELGLVEILRMPFERQRPAWEASPVGPRRRNPTTAMPMEAP